MTALHKIRAALDALAADLRTDDPESDAAHRAWTAARQIEAQAEMVEKQLIKGA
jgi:hypothetical protein